MVSFFIFVFSTDNRKYVPYEILPMTGFKFQTSGIRNDRSANWATTTAPLGLLFTYGCVTVFMDARKQLCNFDFNFSFTKEVEMLLQ